MAQQPTGDGLGVVELRPNFYVIGGAGGNILAQIGPVCVIVVDSGTTDAADRVVAAIRRLSPLPIRYVINTGMDAEHVGGNEKLARSGLSILAGALAAGAGLGDSLLTNAGGASVLAHENDENPGLVPHYLPGANPWINELTQNHGIPLDAVMGGPLTMYPEYRKTLKDTSPPG